MPIPKHMHQSWWDKLAYTEPILNYIGSQIASTPICPVDGNVFRAFSLPLKDVKLAIVGQDCYPNASDATGIAFAVEADRAYRNYPFSLKIIADVFCESGGEADTFFDPTLELWIRQGALMLNAALTCKQGIPGSHRELWKPWMKELFKLLNNTEPKVFLFFGKIAEEQKQFIDTSVHRVVTCPHPAALAYGNNIDKSVFVEAFKQTEQYYRELYNNEFTWVLPF